MKYIIVLLLAPLMLLVACKKKEKIEFTLTNLTLKKLNKENLPKQNLFLKVIRQENSNEQILVTTDKYPSEYTLPAKFGIEKPIKMNFYKNTYRVALYGDSSGYIGSNPINIKDYKILYPLDMETEENGISIVLSGTWK